MNMMAKPAPLLAVFTTLWHPAWEIRRWRPRQNVCHVALAIVRNGSLKAFPELTAGRAGWYTGQAANRTG
jgi:hypothetical protein